MKFIDLNEEYRSIKKSIDKAVFQTIKSGQFILGENVAALEKKIVELTGVKFAVGLNSGSDALFLALKALGVDRGDEVITTPFTFVATAEAIVSCGAKPVFVDINPDTYNIEGGKIEKAITKRTKAIIPVHLYGQMAEMRPIMKMARRHSLFVIEDAAQALGAKQEGKAAGSVGDIGCFSFFPTKNLGAYGDAGMIVTKNKTWADMIRMLRNHGSSSKYRHEFLGVSSRLDELQAAVLLAKLPHLKKWIARRIKLAASYTRGLSGTEGFQTPLIKKGNVHVFNQYTIRTKKRDKLQTYLQKQGIPTIIHYPLPLHLQPAFKYLGYRTGDFPQAEKVAKEVLSLPLYPELKISEQNRVIKLIRKFFS